MALCVAMTLEQCWHRVPGGTATAALNLARALRERDDVDLVGVAGHHRRQPPEPWRPPVPVRSLPLAGPFLYESWHRLRFPRVERATGPVDVVHAISLAIPPSDAPLVVTVHDLAFLHEPAHFTRHGVRFLGRGLERARRHAALVLCSSRATLDDCRAHGFDPDRLRLVPLGVTAPPVDDDDVDRVRRRHGLDRPYVLWAGTVEPRKNLPGLVAAFRQLDRELDLVLAGPAGWNEDLDRLLDGLGDRVHVVGFVAGDELAALYAGASVFCYPSLREGFGFPVLEAMAQGTPVVTSTGTSTAELGEGGAAVLVEPTDAGAIAAGIEHALNDEGGRLAAAGSARVTEYTWARTAELVVAAYREAAGRS